MSRSRGDTVTSGLAPGAPDVPEGDGSAMAAGGGAGGAPSPAPTAGRAQGISTWDLFILGVSVLVIVLLGIETFAPLSAPTRRILFLVDFGICAIFLLDFVHSLVQARHRWRYLVAWGWLDLASSIPAILVLRWARFARVLRIVRVLRGFRSLRNILRLLSQRRAEGTLTVVVVSAITMVVVSSISVLHVEQDVGGRIHSPDDALWWAFSTITTVGYGDVYPGTLGGRLIAGVLAVAGVGLFSVFTAFVASWFVGREDAGSGAELEALRAEVRALRRLIESRDGRPGGDDHG